MKLRIFWGIILILLILMFSISFYFLFTQKDTENEMRYTNIINSK